MSKVHSARNDSTIDSTIEVREQVRTSSNPLRARVRKTLLIGAASTLCLVTLGEGTVGAVDKTISIVVDGRSRTVTTEAGSVGGVLAAVGLSPAATPLARTGRPSPLIPGRC